MTVPERRNVVGVHPVSDAKYWRLGLMGPTARP